MTWESEEVSLDEIVEVGGIPLALKVRFGVDGTVSLLCFLMRKQEGYKGGAIMTAGQVARHDVPPRRYKETDEGVPGGIWVSSP